MRVVRAVVIRRMNNVLFNNNLVIHRQYLPRRPRVYRHCPSQLHDSFTDEKIQSRYRFRKNSIGYICDIVRQDSQRPTKRNHALSVKTQVLASLRSLASGCFYQVDADVLGIEKLLFAEFWSVFVRH